MNHNHLAVTELLENNINHLPITSQDVIFMLKKRGWKVFEYDLNNQKDVEKINTFKVMKAVQKYGTFSYKYKDIKVVFYPINQSSDKLTFELGHELGHIAYGHFSESGILGHHEDTVLENMQEIEASEFSRALIAPICILKKTHSISKEDINRYTNLNLHHSGIRSGECKLHKLRYTNEEIKLINNFKNYIQKTNEKSNIIKIAISSILTTVIFLLGTSFYYNDRINTTSSKTKNTVTTYANNTYTDTILEQDASQSITGDTTIVIYGNEYDNSMTVYKTKTGRKFHKESCGHLKNRKGVTTLLLEHAYVALDACLDCF